MNEPAPCTSLRTTFVALIITNGLIGLADFVVAMLLLFRTTVVQILSRLSDSVASLSSIITKLTAMLTTMTPHAYEIAIFYFVSHAAIKLFLCWALLKNKLWAYPLAIIFFGLFSLYQLRAVISAYTFFDFLLLMFNIVVLWMVVREYRQVRAVVKPVVY
jgi:uncharacterized membrane protein